MTGIIVLQRGKETVSFRMPDDTVLNHVAQLATFLGRDIEIAAFDEGGSAWRG